MATASVYFSYISHAIDSFVLLITWDASTALLASCLSNVPNVHIHSILNLDGNMDGREKQNLHYYLSDSFIAIDNDADCFLYRPRSGPQKKHVDILPSFLLQAQDVLLLAF